LRVYLQIKLCFFFIHKVDLLFSVDCTNMLRALMASSFRRYANVLMQTQRRNYEVICTPPRVFIPMWEKILHGVLLCSMILGYPFWVICHIDYYIKVGTGEIKLD
ncbi:hypothetical protein T10_10497, partial [Trichinella papuae]